jgi:IMP dehydrogenase
MSGLSFDDVLLSPRLSEITSRKFIALETELFEDYMIELPILSANMPSVTGPEMAIAMYQSGGYGFLPRFNTIGQAASEYVKVLDGEANAVISLGLDDYKIRMLELYDVGARHFCIDVAHGHHVRVIEAIDWLKSARDINLIAGNVATADGAFDLTEAGADVIKVGIGPGAACTTREVSGFGVPQLSAIMDVNRIKEAFDYVKIIADGGIKNSGDIVKALAFGADTVMIGRLLAGTDESRNPGEYYGNASTRVRDYRSPEGVIGEVERNGPVTDVLKTLAWGIKSGLSYAGAASIAELHANPVEAVTVTPQGMWETLARV